MKKIFTALFLLCLTTFSYGQDTMYINADELNIREGAGTKFSVIGKAKQGDKIVVVSKVSNWSEIETQDGTKGFVSTKFLSTTAQTNTDTPRKKGTNPFLGALIILGIIGYGIYKIKNFFSGSSSNNKKTTTSRSRVSTPKPTEKKSFSIADVRVKANNYLETFDENGKRISGMFLGSSESFMGFTERCFITVKDNNYLTTYNAESKRINGMFLGSKEYFHGCAGNTFTTKKENNYITTYDTNCKKVSGRFA